MNDNIEEKLRKIKMKEIRNKSLGLILSLIIIEILFCIVNNFFLFFAWMVLLPLLLIFQQEIFFKKAVFCYGKIIDIKKEKSLVNPGVEDEGYCITIINEIEFIDNYSNKTYKTEFSCDGSIRKLNLIIERALTIGTLEKVNTINSEIIMKALNDISLV